MKISPLATLGACLLAISAGLILPGKSHAATASSSKLLFPFASNQLGFDTGIAISNTSKDTFGTTPESGTCILYFYGPGAPPSGHFTTPQIPSGTTYTGLVSGIAAGFQGYVIADCALNYAHGFAFVQAGSAASSTASGYNALVINKIPRPKWPHPENLSN